MKIALVADLHGNMTAVAALEKDLKRRGADQIWCLGDAVGKGPSSDRTFDWARANCQVMLRGNWDEGVGAKQFANDAFYHEQLGEARLGVLRSLPLEASLTLSGKRLRFIHGRPVMDRLYTVTDPEELLAPFFLPDYHYLFYGDAHRQAVRTLSCGLMVNVGSVGNGLGIPHLAYALIEGEERGGAPLDITLVNLPYDNRAAAEEARLRPGMRSPDAYIGEVLTGVYARHLQSAREA